MKIIINEAKSCGAKDIITTSKDYKFFPESPTLQKTKTYTADHTSQVFSFTDAAQISVGSTVGISLSADKDLGMTNVTAVLSYQSGTELNIISNTVGDMVNDAFQNALVTYNMLNNVSVDIIDTEANILAMSDLTTGVIAYAIDTGNLMIYDADDIDHWSIYEEEE